VVFAVVKKYGGSISAEAGIGVMKRDLLPSVKDPVALDSCAASSTCSIPKISQSRQSPLVEHGSANGAFQRHAVHLRDGIGRITFNRPQARNAFTFEMYERLAQICSRRTTTARFKVLVMQGAGDKAFASGTDINQFRAFTTPQHALDYEARIDRVLTQLEQCRVPTIAAITGRARRRRAASRACCDLRIGTKTVKFGFPIARTLGNACRCRISAGSLP